MSPLKKYSVILPTSFYDINQKILTIKGSSPNYPVDPVLRLQVRMNGFICVGRRHINKI